MICFTERQHLKINFSLKISSHAFFFSILCVLFLVIQPVTNTAQKAINTNQHDNQQDDQQDDQHNNQHHDQHNDQHGEYQHSNYPMYNDHDQDS